MTKVLNNKAITLIALVITIVVLIILAAVAINLSLGNNGIFNRAKTAKEQYQNAENYEQGEIARTTNRIDGYSTVESTRDSLKTTILYPNGTAANPANITKNQRIEVNNPFPGHTLYLIAQVRINNIWGELGFIYSNGGYGVKATQLQGNNVDKIVIQSGGVCLNAYSTSDGSGFGTTTNYTSLPYRVIVVCLD